MSPPGLRNGNCHSALNSRPRSPTAAKLASEAADTLTHPCPLPAPIPCAQTAVTAGRPEGPPRAWACRPAFQGLERCHGSSEARPEPGAGESTPRMRWLIKVPRTDGRQCQQNGFWAAGWHILPLSDLCCVLRGRALGPLPKLRCFHIHPSSIKMYPAFPHIPSVHLRPRQCPGRGDEGSSPPALGPGPLSYGLWMAGYRGSCQGSETLTHPSKSLSVKLTHPFFLGPLDFSF